MFAELQPQENTQERTRLAAFICQQSLRLNQSYTKSLSMSYGHIVKQANLRKEHMKNSYDRQRTLQKKNVVSEALHGNFANRKIPPSFNENLSVHILSC